MFTLGIGHELISVLAVVTAFFGGLALGAYALDAFIARSKKPSRVFAALEAIVGVSGILSIFAIPFANRILLMATGVESSGPWHSSASFLIPFLTLLPATFCMGATLPAIERIASITGVMRRPISGLYAANTLGAALGVVATAFIFTPWLGYSTSALIFGASGLLGALIAAFWRPFQIAASAEVSNRSGGFDPILVILFFTGLLGIGFEVACTRALAQFFEDSVFTYAILLLNYLLGTSLGAFAYKTWPSKWMPASNSATSAYLLGILGATCLCSALLIQTVESVGQLMTSVMAQGRLGQFTGEFVASGLVFIPPTMVMGAIFSHFAQLAKDSSLGLGRALAINTLGGALAPIAIGVLLIPLIGLRLTFVLIGVGYVALIFPWRFKLRGLAITALPLILLLTLPWSLVTLPSGHRLVAYHEGSMSTVAVLEDESGKRSLKTDNRFFQGGTASITAERMKSHLPLLLHPSPARGLWIGLGTGVTFGAAVDYPILRADAVELDPGIMKMLPSFAPHNRYPYDAVGRGHRLFTADARRFARTIPDTYDVIVADFFQPNHDGAATLYTLEHFRAIRSQLRPGGQFCQWLPLYQLDELSLRIIIKTFLEVYPQVRAYLGNFNAHMPGLALIGSDTTVHYSADYFKRRVTDAGLQTMLMGEAITDEFKLAAFYLASRKNLEDYAGIAPVNTDDHPRVMYINPGFTTVHGYTTYGRLEKLLANNLPNPADWSEVAHDSTSIRYHENLKSVFEARNYYLRGAIAEYEGDMDLAIQFFLMSAAASPHFTIGYAKCLLTAIAKAQEEPKWSKDLLLKLIESRPEIEDAHTLMKELFPE